MAEERKSTILKLSDRDCTSLSLWSFVRVPSRNLVQSKMLIELARKEHTDDENVPITVVGVTVVVRPWQRTCSFSLMRT